MKSTIKEINARQILDSRANPGLFVTVELECGAKGYAGVPSGASCGKFEAVELRNKQKDVYLGRGVLAAANNVNNKISKLLKGICVLQGRKIDELMLEADGTENKSNFGANAILGISLACARAASCFLNLPLYKYLGGICANTIPTPMINIINGGAHSNNKLDFQEFMITPVGADSFHYGLRMCTEVFYQLKNLLSKNGFSTSVGDEGGFAPDISVNRQVLDLILQALQAANYTTDEIKICLDVAASEFFKEGKYILKGENKEFTSDEMIEYLKNLTEDYPIISIEDGLAQDDYLSWQKLTKILKNKVLLTGDDLFVTNTKLLIEGIESKIANSIIIKPNQIGTLSETIDAIKIASHAGYKTIISHRSGETNDSFIADLAVGLNTGLIKAGCVSRGERVCKYNRLLEIESELNREYRGCNGDNAKYLGIFSYFNNYNGNFYKSGCFKK